MMQVSMFNKVGQNMLSLHLCLILDYLAISMSRQFECDIFCMFETLPGHLDTF